MNKLLQLGRRHPEALSATEKEEPYSLLPGDLREPLRKLSISVRLGRTPNRLRTAFKEAQMKYVWVKSRKRVDESLTWGLENLHFSSVL